MGNGSEIESLVKIQAVGQIIGWGVKDSIHMLINFKGRVSAARIWVNKY